MVFRPYVRWKWTEKYALQPNDINTKTIVDFYVDLHAVLSNSELYHNILRFAWVNMNLLFSKKKIENLLIYVIVRGNMRNLYNVKLLILLGLTRNNSFPTVKYCE